MKSVPVLHTDRCTLAAITSEDIPMLREILEDQETQRFLPELCIEFKKSDSLPQFIAAFDRYLLQDEGILWGIRLEGDLIGFIAIMDITACPCLFYAVHSRYRNQHIMAESFPVVIDYLDSNHVCSELNTEVIIQNIASLKLLASKGFTQTDTNGKVLYLKKSFSL